MESTDTPAVLLLNLPEGALAGIDLLSFTTTPRFRGVKHLPRGLHFVFVGSSTAFSERHGIWFSISNEARHDLCVTKWDSAIEALTTLKEDAEILRQRANLSSIWDGLTPYRQVTAQPQGNTSQEESGDWPTLTASISPSLLSRITGSKTEWKLSSASSSRRDLEEIPGLTAEDMNLDTEQELHFLPIDLKQTWREGATGRERTDAAQDRSWALNDLIESHCTDGDANDIVGELQFCFLMILTVNNFSCLEQWKRILSLIFTCRTAVAARPDFFVSAIAALRLQLQHCKDAEGGLIDLADEGGSLLRKLLTRFRKGLDELGSLDVQDVKDELDDLEDYLKEEHGWQFGGQFAKSGVLELADGEQVRMDTTAFDEDDETGEFAPQIVDLTPEQARLLGVQDEFDLPGGLQRAALDEVESEEEEDIDDHNDSEDSRDLDEMDARY